MRKKLHFGIRKQISRLGGKRHELTLSQRKLAIQLLEQNKSQSEIAKRLSCSQSQISRISARKIDILALYANSKNPDSIRRKSRPRRTIFSKINTSRLNIGSGEEGTETNSCIGDTEDADSLLNKTNLHSVISRIANLSQDSNSNSNCEIGETETNITCVDARIDSSTMEEMCSSTNDVIDPRDHSPSPHPDSDEVESCDPQGMDDFRPVPDSARDTGMRNSTGDNVLSDYHDDSILDDYALDLSNMRPRRGKALTLVHKKLIIEMLDAKKSQTEIARLFGKSQSVVSRMAAKKARILDQWNNIQGGDRARLIREKDDCEALLCPNKSSPKVTTTGHVSEEEEATSSSDIYHKRQALSLSQKMEIIEMLNHKSSQRDIAKVYGKSQAVISRIAGRKEIILNEWEKQSRIKSRLNALYPDVTMVTESGASIYESSSDVSVSDIQESEEIYARDKSDPSRYDVLESRSDQSYLDRVDHYQSDRRTDAYSGDVERRSVTSEGDVVTVPSVVREARSWFRLPSIQASQESDDGDASFVQSYDIDVRNTRAYYSVPGISRRKRYRGLLVSERKLAIKLLGENKSQTEIARILGCSQSQISRIQAKKNSILNMSDGFLGNGGADDMMLHHGNEQSVYESGRSTPMDHAGVGTEASVHGQGFLPKQEYCETGTESNGCFTHFPSVSNTTTTTTTAAAAKYQPHHTTTSSELDQIRDGSNQITSEPIRNEQFVHSGFDSNTTSSQFDDLAGNTSAKFDSVDSDPVPSAADALNGLRTIRRYMQFSGIQNFQFFNSLESQLFGHISKLLR